MSKYEFFIFIFSSGLGFTGLLELWFGVFLNRFWKIPNFIFSDAALVLCFLLSLSGTLVKCMLNLLILSFMFFMISSISSFCLCAAL